MVLKKSVQGLNNFVCGAGGGGRGVEAGILNLFSRSWHWANNKLDII